MAETVGQDLVRSLNIQSLRVHRDELGRFLATDDNGKTETSVTPMRLFPLSDPDHWIVLLDERGREVACVEHPEILPAETAKLLRDELQIREFVPVLKRIEWVSGNTMPCRWRVQTDRGNTELIVNDEKDLRRLGPYGILIVDTHSIRYLLPDVRQTDEYTRRIIEWHIA